MSGRPTITLITVFISLAAAGVAVGWCAYQQFVAQPQAQERLAAAIVEELEFRRKTEESVKQQTSEKLRAQELLMQLDYEKELVEALRKEIAAAKQESEQRYDKLEVLVRTSREDSERILAGQLQAHQQELAAVSARLQEVAGLLDVCGRQLEQEAARAGRHEQQIALLAADSRNAADSLKKIRSQSAMTRSFTEKVRSELRDIGHRLDALIAAPAVAGGRGPAETAPDGQGKQQDQPAPKDQGA